MAGTGSTSEAKAAEGQSVGAVTQSRGVEGKAPVAVAQNQGVEHKTPVAESGQPAPRKAAPVQNPQPPSPAPFVVDGQAAAAAPEAPEMGQGIRPVTDAAAKRILERMLNQVTRVEGEPVRLGLAEAVRAAVQNNPGIRAQADVPKAEAWGVLEASGAFDPTVRANSLATTLSAPTGNALTSGPTQVTFDEDSVRSGASISKLLLTGATVDLAWTNQIVKTNSTFFALNPRYDNRLFLSFRQPLLRDLGAIDENTTVLVAHHEAEESLAAFEADLATFVSETIGAYWIYVQAAADLEVNRRSVALAQELVRDAEARVEVGLLAPVAVKEALADAAAREERALVSENQLAVAARVLQHQVMLGAAEGRIAEPVIPAEEHLVTPIELDRENSLRTAAKRRAEIRGATIALGRQRLEEKRARNQKLPNLDFLTHYGLAGLSGDADGNITPYDGDFADSLDDMFSNDFNEVAVGLELEIPLGNSEAKARFAATQIEVRRASRQLEQVISTVALEVERALTDVASAAKRVTASKAARDLAEENLRNQQRRFELGSVTTKDVLDFQEKLAESMAAQVRAITDHARAVTRLRRADGTLLARFGIEIERPEAPGRPWWSRF